MQNQSQNNRVSSLLADPIVTKVVGWGFNLVIVVIGFFLINTLNGLQSAIELNRIEIEKVKAVSVDNSKQIIETNARVTTIEKVNGNKLDLILEQQKLIFQKFEQYDSDIKEFYQKYDLKPKK